MLRTVCISKTLLDRMFQHALRMYPEECCGVLIGRQGEHGTAIERVVEADNIAPGDRRRSYQICWRVLLSTVRAVRSGEGDIIGFYHSHPDGSSRPSAADLMAAWTDYAYLLLPIRRGPGREVTCWRVREDGAPFDREEVRVAYDRWTIGRIPELRRCKDQGHLR